MLALSFMLFHCSSAMPPPKAQMASTDHRPVVEYARKMEAIEGMQPQIDDMEPVLENAIKTLQKVVDVRGMGRKSMADP